MRDDRVQELNKALELVVGPRNLLISEELIKPYSTCIRVGQGKASAVALPNDLIQFWKVLKLCISHQKNHHCSGSKYRPYRRVYT